MGLSLLVATLACNGCTNVQPEVVIVPPGTTVMAAEDFEVKIYVYDAALKRWVPGRGKTKVPRGYYIGPGPTTRPQ